MRDFSKALRDFIVIFSNMGVQTIAAVLDSVRQNIKIAAAVVTESIERAVAKQTVEIVFVRTGMTGEKLAFAMGKVAVISAHNTLVSIE